MKNETKLLFWAEIRFIDRHMNKAQWRSLLLPTFVYWIWFDHQNSVWNIESLAQLIQMSNRQMTNYWKRFSKRNNSAMIINRKIFSAQFDNCDKCSSDRMNGESFQLWTTEQSFFAHFDCRPEQMRKFVCRTSRLRGNPLRKLSFKRYIRSRWKFQEIESVA